MGFSVICDILFFKKYQVQFEVNGVKYDYLLNVIIC